MDSTQHEHLVWRYFSMKLQEAVEERQESISEELFSEWLTAYLNEKSLVLEAVIVDVIKKSRLDASQLERVKETCSNKEVQKQESYIGMTTVGILDGFAASKISWKKIAGAVRCRNCENHDLPYESYDR